ncbi:unnamed protein product [Rotaria sordida]|uniref:Uncharacterized protein n=1 Tax=Rotaria sordida TaxID=392033 RepID=A0A819YEA7_9BILA|nr:unnamed protein product [Rotaria sordida]CAF4155408.1 unnamed protein product [Rotaria sordida]
MDLPSFHNNLLISSLFPFKTENNQILSSKTKRHSFLNGLALLLNGSNQCTSVYPWLKKKQLLITRNEPLTNDDETYFNQFFDLIRKYTMFCLINYEKGMNEIYSTLKFIIFQYNKKKCIKRILDPLFDDVILNLEKLLNYDIDKICENINIDKLIQGSADYIYLQEQKISLKEFISILLSRVKNIILRRDSIKINKNESEPKMIEIFQVYCESLYHSKIFRSILLQVYSNDDDHERIIYYLDKVSAHLRSLDLILKTLEKRTSDYGEIYQNIHWYFIEPIENIINLNEAPSLSFDKIWLAFDLLHDDELKNDFKQKYIGNKFVEYDTKLKLSTCLHSEIRMIDYLIEQNIQVDDYDIEIGISKLPCCICSLYIKKLNEEFNRNFCVTSITHGKIYPNWAFRNNEDDDIMSYVNDELYTLIERQIKDWIRINRKKMIVNYKPTIELQGDHIANRFVKRNNDCILENQ